MKAEIIAIGSELLLGQVVNSNAAYLSEELSKLGIDIFFHTTVGDNPDRMKSAFDIASKRADLIICTGGLGPTPDDITNETWGDFFGLDILEDAEQRKILEEKFKGRKIPEINFKQASRPKGSKVIPNKIGTAPGIILEKSNKIIITFPGVPVEMEEMFQSHIKSYLSNQVQERGETSVITSRDIKLSGITESQMAQEVKDLFDAENPSIAPYATLGECRLRITAKAETLHQANNMIQALQMKVESKLKDYIYGYDDDSLEGVLAKKLIDKGYTLSFAESCTGGLLSKIMTDVPGSSEYTKINLVTYSNEDKAKFLNISLDDINKHGAVSLETARAMVEGLEKVTGSDICVSITGIAGPDGATDEKPIGTIYLGIIYPADGVKKTMVTKLDWLARPLDRESVRVLAAKKTLNILRKLV